MDNLKPVLKWAGGKRQLRAQIMELIPGGFNRYYEPFLGGGAILFALMPSKATVSDLNSELVNVYEVIKEEPDALIEKLKHHSEQHCKAYYYEIRALDRCADYSQISKVDKAARTIYLNRVCYNGLYRVSRKGYFNTPFGNQPAPDIVREAQIRAISDYFRMGQKDDIVIRNMDYLTTLSDVQSGDFVYLDPPYEPLSPTSSFTNYTQWGFTQEQQKQLKAECDRLTKKGVRFIQSNSNCEFINDLYRGYHIVTVEASRNINRNASGRKKIKEVLIYNY